MKLKEWSLVLAWAVALAGVLMSLFYSVIALNEPCSLCWAQRVALFPLALQLGIAAYRSDRAFALYAYPLCLFGLAAALYQSLLPLWPSLQRSCGSSGDCTENLPTLFGIPFPWVSALGFLLILFFLRIGRIIPGSEKP